MVKVDLPEESFGLICDAIEIAIGRSGFNCDCHERFTGMKDVMQEIVTELEKQSGCQTLED